MTFPVKASACVSLALLCAACADAPYDPIVDGPKDARYTSDLDACRQLSQQKQSDNSGAIAGAVIGGLVGAAEEDVEGAVAGAAVGGLIGSAEDGLETEKARDAIVFNCMRGRGHNVVG